MHLGKKLMGAKRTQLGMTYSTITEDVVNEWKAMDEQEKQRFAAAATPLIPTTNVHAFSAHDHAAIRRLFAQTPQD